jgi:hypothetical protein
MLGGDLHWLWSPYAIYMNVDYVSDAFVAICHFIGV